MNPTKLIIYILATPAVVFLAIVGWPPIAISVLDERTDLLDDVNVVVVGLAAVTSEMAWIVFLVYVLFGLGVLTA